MTAAAAAADTLKTKEKTNNQTNNNTICVLRAVDSPASEDEGGEKE